MYIEWFLDWFALKVATLISDLCDNLNVEPTCKVSGTDNVKWFSTK